MDAAAIESLKERIAQQKVLYRSLETDIENPRLLDTQIETTQAIVSELPARLDAEIEAALTHLNTLVTTRDNKIAAKESQLFELVERRDNLKDLLIAAWDDLQAMNQSLKRLQHSDALAKLKALRDAAAKIEAELPEHLRQSAGNTVSIDEGEAA